MKAKHNHFIPHYSYLPIISCAIFGNLIYFVTKLLYDPARAYDLSLGIDQTLPYLSPFILIYVLAYLQWVFGYIMIARESRDEIYKAAATNAVAKTFCGIIFLAIPTVMLRAEIAGNGILDSLTNFIYAADTPAVNLFPSIHCLESWSVFRFTLRTNLPKAYKIAMGLFTFAVFASVLFVKQHIFLDIPAGILVFELAYLIVKYTKIDQKIAKLFQKQTKPSC